MTVNKRPAQLLAPLAIAAAAVGLATFWFRKDPIFAETRTSQASLKRVGGALPFVGDAAVIAKNFNRLHDFFLETFETTNNETFVLKLPFAPALFMVNDPAIVEFVLKTRFDVFEKGADFRQTFHDFLGVGIFNSDGESWKYQRKLAAKIFNVKNFKEFVNDVFSSEMQSFGAVLSEFAPTGELFDLHELFFRFTFDSFVQIGFGIEINTIRAAEKPEFMVAFDSIQSRSAIRLFSSSWKYFEYFSRECDVHAAQIKTLRDFGRSIIQQKREKNHSGGQERDLLGLLMKVKDENGAFPSEEALIDHVLNFLIAGRDTTAVALSWAVFLLHKNPPALTKLLSEISTILDGTTPTYDQIRNDMPYANAVFHETLRLYPSLPRGGKEAQEDITLPDGTFVPKGSRVGWSGYAMGRTEAIWGPDAKEFKPERWLQMKKQPSPFDYPVFNAGPRLCLGKGMAELEGVFVLVELIREFEIEFVEEEQVVYGISILLPMKNGLKVKCKKRV
ncbi:Protein kinase alk2 [Podochytrium sp. JEL0797]|nr:Protein kinase alk2 [Podochytrium sp. JEL0797]